MTSITYKYIRKSRLWMAKYNDSIGPVGPPAFGLTKEGSAYSLGFLFGTNPVAFARTIEELTKGETA